MHTFKQLYHENIVPKKLWSKSPTKLSKIKPGNYDFSTKYHCFNYFIGEENVGLKQIAAYD